MNTYVLVPLFMGIFCEWPSILIFIATSVKVHSEGLAWSSTHKNCKNFLLQKYLLATYTVCNT